MAIGNSDLGTPKRITTATTTQVSSVPGGIRGILIASTSTATLALYDNNAGNTTNQIVGTMTLPAGPSFTLCPMAFANGLVAVTTGTLDITLSIVS